MSELFLVVIFVTNNQSPSIMAPVRKNMTTHLDFVPHIFIFVVQWEEYSTYLLPHGELGKN